MANGQNAELAIAVAAELFRAYQNWRSKARMVGATDAQIDAAIRKFNPDAYPDPLSFEGNGEVPQTDPRNEPTEMGDGIYYTSTAVKPDPSNLKAGDRVYQKPNGMFYAIPENGPGVNLPVSWLLVMQL